jgi:hypothetical protein
LSAKAHNTGLDLFRSFEIAGRIDASYAMPYETDRPICVLRAMKMSLNEYRSQVKNDH